MKIKVLMKQLRESYPENKDMNYDSLLSEVSQPNIEVKKISYGKESSPIVAVPPYTGGESGFRFTIQTSTGLSQIPVTYGPKVRELLLKKFSEHSVVLD